MKDKIKNILKIFRIYYIVLFIILAIPTLIFQILDPSESNFLISLLVPILYPITHILYILVFLPAIVTLYFLFKKFKGAKTRIFLTAFLIPFSNMIYYFIEYFITNNTDCYISMFIGFYSIVFLLPSILFATLFVPKSLLPFKIEAIKALSLMFILGWILIIITSICTKCINYMIDTYGLEKYKPIIEQIEQYKKENGVYPNNVENNIKDKKYKYFNYQALNNDKDFVLTLATHQNSIAKYRYCSNESFEDCHEGFYDYQSHYKIGKWIKAIIED